MMWKRIFFARGTCGAALAVVCSGFSGGCDQTVQSMPKPPDPDQMAPFSADTLELFYQLSPAQTESLLKNNRDITIIDLRAPEHFAAAHIARAINIPFPSDTFEAEAKKLDPGAKILIYGYLGMYAIDEKVAMDAVKMLRIADYRNLYWLADGYPAWIAAGKPVVDLAGNIVESPPQGPMPEEIADPTTPGGAPKMVK
jgi:rhodanese-related sulfurtransferase